jgi:hypothetical protein
MTQMLEILLIFAERGDAIVKGYLAKKPVLENLLSLLDMLSDTAVVPLLKAIRALTMEVSSLISHFDALSMDHLIFRFISAMLWSSAALSPN